MKDTFLFDLGNTLVGYYTRDETPIVLAQSLAAVRDFLRDEGLLRVTDEDMALWMFQENREAGDYRVRPLPERLIRVFRLDPLLPPEVIMAMCRRFMRPIFARAHLYADSIPTLQWLRARGFRTAVVSNSPWGSPAALWREEIARLGLTPHLDLAVFCGDVGWRKPARQILDYTLERLGAQPAQCLFVGDDPRWDLVGPRAIGMEALLIDRSGGNAYPDEAPLRSLDELIERLDASTKW